MDKDDIGRIFDDTEFKDLVIAKEYKFKVGDRVRITTGKYKGKIGTISGIIDPSLN